MMHGSKGCLMKGSDLPSSTLRLVHTCTLVRGFNGTENLCRMLIPPLTCCCCCCCCCCWWEEPPPLLRGTNLKARSETTPLRYPSATHNSPFTRDEGGPCETDSVVISSSDVASSSVVCKHDMGGSEGQLDNTTNICRP